MSLFQAIYSALFITLFSSCSFKQTSEKYISKNTDSLLLVKYRNEIIRNQSAEEVLLMSEEDIEANWGNSRLDYGIINYAPDNSFKIVTFMFESCGAYCNTELYSWIHFNLKGKEQIKKVDFYSIDSIYQLPEKKYLIIGNHGHRPAGVLTVNCITSNLIFFDGDSLITRQIDYKNQKNYTNSFSFCQENGADIASYLKYDGAKKILSYNYANNYSYSKKVDIDTIRHGQFTYIRGYFFLERETIKVQDNRTLPVKSNEWTEIYKLKDTDTSNIHINIINEHQLVYDCIGCNSYESEAIRVSSVTNYFKKELFTLPTNNAYVEKILLLEIQGNNFIYVATNETSGNSDGHLYYLNSDEMTTYKVKVEKSQNNLPKAYDFIGKYAHLEIDETTKEISTTFYIIDTASENRRGSVTTSYKLQKIKNNQFILKKAKSVTHFED